MTTARRALTALTTATLLALATSACSTRAPSDAIVLYYKSGAGDNKTFKECIEPGTAGAYPLDDEIFYLPTSLRTWNIRPYGGDIDQPIHSGTRPISDQPSPEVAIYATADFYLNTDCTKGEHSPIVQFWENTGRRYGLAVDNVSEFRSDQWRALLLNTLVPAEEKALREATRSYTADALDANQGGIWKNLEHQIAPLFTAELRAKVGGDYFCGAGYQRGKKVEWTEWVPDGFDVDGASKVREELREGTCPPVRISITDINFANPDIAAARANVFKAEQEAKAALIAAQSQVAVAGALSQAGKDANYLRLRELEIHLQTAQTCAANPNCTLVIGAPGVNITPK